MFHVLQMSLSACVSEEPVLDPTAQVRGRQRYAYVSGVVPLRHLRHVPPPPDGVATLVNSLQNRVKSIILCAILNAKNGEKSL